MLSATRAAAEGYRYIYSQDSREQMYFELASQDYHAIRFDGFADWLLEQQSALRKVLAGGAVPTGVDSVSDPPSESDECIAPQDDGIHEVKIDHHGWGQRSLILIRNARRKAQGVEIENVDLRAFCDPHRTNMDGLSEFPWAEMNNRIQCFGQRVSSDLWLVLFSRQDPPSGEDMSRFATGIMKALREDTKCVRPSQQMFVVEFLQQG
jgi:hypothetical protein